jgi:predicted phage-related endonuclease
MATTQTRWNLVVSSETDKSLRQHLADSGGGRKGDLSKFVEEAVRERIFLETALAAQEQNKNVPQEDIDSAIEEALAWARSRR